MNEIIRNLTTRRALLIAFLLSAPSVGNVSTQPAQPSNESPAAIPASVLVNDPNADANSAGVTQLRSSITLGSGSHMIAAFLDTGSYPKYTGYARSSDGGATWTDLGALPGSVDLGAPVLARDTVSGRVYLSTYSAAPFNRVQLFRSDDDGLTWLPPVDATAGTEHPVLWQTMAVDNFPGAGQGNVYVATTQADDPGYSAGASTSRDPVMAARRLRRTAASLPSLWRKQPRSRSDPTMRSTPS